MNNWFITFLSMSVSGTLLIFTLLLLKPLYKNKLSKNWQYYIWLIVIARLILPFAPETNIACKFFTDIDAHIIEPAENAYLGNKDTIFPKAAAENEVQVFRSASDTQKETIIPPNVWIIWLTAALILLIRKITIYQSFVKYVRAGCEDVTDIEHLEQFGRILETQKIKTGIELRTNSLISSPLMIGFLKPCIILPTGGLSASDFKYTILHELTHYRRLDIFYKWLTQTAICLHWFNPFVYLISREINQACELSCDETIISKLDAKGQRAYGDTLLNAVKTGGNYKNSVASVTLYESRKLLSERLDAIMSYKKQSGILACLSAFFAIFFLCGAAFAGAYPVQEQTNSAQAPDNIPVSTAKAAAVTQVDSPNVDITIDNGAAVRFVTANNNEITVDYGNTLYNVDVLNEYGNWEIHISYIGSYSKYPAAVLYVPAAAYGDINIQAEKATVYLDAVFQNCGNINADMKSSSVFYTIPAGFTGKLKAAVPDSYVELRSDDGYRNCNITISNCASFGEVADIFTKQGEHLKYSDGTEAGVIAFDFKGGGYAVIFPQNPANASTAARNKFDTADLPEFTVNSSGIIEIPVAIDSLGSGSEICIGEIPDIRSANKIRYDVQSESGGSLYIGFRKAIETDNVTRWFNYIGSGTGNVSWENDGPVRFDTEYTGNYFVYIQSKYGSCSDIKGSVKIEYNIDRSFR